MQHHADFLGNSIHQSICGCLDFCACRTLCRDCLLCHVERLVLAFYTLSFAMIFLFYRLLKKLYQAQLTADFAKISKALKLVMLLGIISLSFYLLS